MSMKWIEGQGPIGFVIRSCENVDEVINIERETYMATSIDSRMLTCELANPQPGCEKRKTSQYIPNVDSGAEIHSEVTTALQTFITFSPPVLHEQQYSTAST
jgi:hypothetical protein